MPLQNALLVLIAFFLLVVVIRMAINWHIWLRRIKVLWFLKKRLFFAFLVVYVLGFMPIGAHLFATIANEQAAAELAKLPTQAAHIKATLGYAIVADAYLYAFIVSLTGCVEAVTASQPSYIIVFLIAAVVAGFGNYNAMLDVINTHQIGSLLSASVWVVLVVCLAGYGGYKLITLYGAAAEEWEVLERQKGAQ